MQLTSTPLFRVAAATAGGILVGAAGRRGRAGVVLRAMGLALIGVALRPAAEESLRSASERRQRLSTHTSLDIDRPVAEVFAFFKDFENFPHVSRGFKSVVDHQDGRSHWEMFTPSGRVLSWDTVVTKYVPNVVIGWRSVPGSVVDMTGLVRFTAVSAERTHIEMDLTYAPTPGQTGLNDALRSLIARTPARRLESTLRRTRAYIETRSPTDTNEPATDASDVATSTGSDAP